MKHLNRLRLDAGFSIADMARAMNVDDTTICRWLTSQGTPEPEQVRQLARLLDVEARDLDEPQQVTRPQRRMGRLRGRLVESGSRVYPMG